MFRFALTYKAASAGRKVVEVNPAYTSQDCSSCGERVPKALKERVHFCPCCGLRLDRDTNAAMNILTLGMDKHSIAMGQHSVKVYLIEPFKQVIVT